MLADRRKGSASAPEMTGSHGTIWSMKTKTDLTRPQYLGIEEVAAELRLSPRSVRRAVASGDLPHVQLRKGGAIRVPASALEPHQTSPPSGEGAGRPGGWHEEPQRAKSPPAGGADQREETT